MATAEENLQVTLIQSELHWHDAVRNREMFAQKMAPLAGSTDLIVLPEMFTTGFSMEPQSIAEPEQGPTLDWMLAQAAALNAVVCGSVAVKASDGYRNRFYWAQPDGQWQAYDKHHLFRMAGEHEHYRGGDERRVVQLKGWRILLQVCYDLRFPVYSRNSADETTGYDLALYVANWPQVREHPWQILLQARAVENLCYVAGVNRVGEDGNGHRYSGRSALIDFKGHSVKDFPAGEAFVETFTLSWSELARFRKVFPAFEDADRFSLQSESE